MIDIKAELDVVNKQFISLHYLLKKVHDITKEPYDIVSKWILKRANEARNIHEVNIYLINSFHELEYVFELENEDFLFLSNKLNLVIKKRCLPVRDALSIIFPDLWGDDDFFEYGFKKEEICNVLPDVNLDDNENASIEKNVSEVSDWHWDVDQNIEIDDHYANIQWETKFAGRKHAIEIIASLSRSLAEKSGNKFLRGKSISASALAGVVVSQLNIEDIQQHRKLIAQALKETSLANQD